MPRRNRPARVHRRPILAPEVVDEPEITCEQMARRLVARGLRSPQILERPQRFTRPKETHE